MKANIALMECLSNTLLKRSNWLLYSPSEVAGLILQQSIVGLSCLRARIVIAFEKNVIIFIAIHGRKSQPIGKLDIEESKFPINS